MWDEQDKRNFVIHYKQQSGQIDNDSFSSEIRKYASDPQYKTFLEIGTWNGLGSTKQFVEGLKHRNDDYAFYSLECNSEKHLLAHKLYQQYPKVHILNEVIFNDTPDNFFDIFPQCKSNALYKRWNDVDIANMKKCEIFLHRKDIPTTFDVILLDGGEFTTYFEYQLLKDKCNILMLDDINVDKCKLIVKEIRSQPDKWEIIKTDNVRNGFMIAKRLK